MVNAWIVNIIAIQLEIEIFVKQIELGDGDAL
jgi:hypothetical protein